MSGFSARPMQVQVELRQWSAPLWGELERSWDSSSSQSTERVRHPHHTKALESGTKQISDQGTGSICVLRGSPSHPPPQGPIISCHLGKLRRHAQVLRRLALCAGRVRQQSLHEQLANVDFICAAFDCSTKSQAREIPRTFEDGRPCPAPLHSLMVFPLSEDVIFNVSVLTTKHVNSSWRRYVYWMNGGGESMEEPSLVGVHRGIYDGVIPLARQALQCLLLGWRPLQSTVSPPQLGRD